MSMSSSFWHTLPKPFSALAPMANVTDAAFRMMFAAYGRPDVFWTEFVAVEGLLSDGRERLLPDLWFGDAEHPIVAQIFGGKPEQFEAIAPFLRDMGFDGIDVNMGCPDRGVEKSGGGASLIKDPARAKAIIRALKRGAGDLPVSVKTRIGYARDEIETWIPALLEEGIAALTVHLRTRNEMSDVPAHWELAPKVAELRARHAPQTLLIGNGDLLALGEARAKVAAVGFDGAMVGRGAFGSPWFFSGRTPELHERLEIMVQHTELFEEMYLRDEKPMKNFDVMKKHYKAYANGFDGAKELRVRLMEAATAAEVRAITEEFLREKGL